MLENNIIITSLVGQFVKETNYRLKPVERECEVCDLLMYDEDNQKMINYGNVNNIIHSDEFKTWHESKGDNNG